MTKTFALIGMALGWGAQSLETESGPEALQKGGLEKALTKSGLSFYWHQMIYPALRGHEAGKQPYEARASLIRDADRALAHVVSAILQKAQTPITIGGDHSMAVGTWSGVTEALNNRRNFGLIWFDAHMDAHTRETSPSDAIHGMPVGLLLGYGDQSLVNCLGKGPILDPKHIVLVGVRSFESGEAALLKKLGVTIFWMEDIIKHGIDRVMEKALQQVTENTDGFGVSVDLDGFDPKWVPGVGTPAENGVVPNDAYGAFNKLFHHPQFKALEIAEFNPTLDKDEKTVNVIKQLLLQFK